MKYAKNASKLHILVGDILSSPKGLFSGYRKQQEVPVQKIKSDYPNSKEKFDWVIWDLYLVIECHGAQHYQATNFGGISNEQALDKLFDQRIKDDKKAQAAVEEGFTYIVIPYWDIKIINQDYILKLYNEHRNYKGIKKSMPDEPDPEYHKQHLERAREYRRARYQRLKSWIESKKQE